MDWKESLRKYDNYLRLEKSLTRNSVLAYINDVKKLAFFLKEQELRINPDEINPKHLKGFVQHLNDKDVSPRTQARTISGVKSFFKFLVIEQIIESNPASNLESPRVGRKLPDVLSVEEVDNLINSIDAERPEGQRNKAILETLYCCGLRVSELINLKVTNLFLKQAFIKVEGKGGKERLVPVADKTIKEINQYIKEYRNNLKIKQGNENVLFLSRRGSKLSRVMIFTIIKNLTEKLNLKKNISPHTFRHSFATHLIHGGADLRAVQEMLGHESIVTTEIYTHLDRQYLNETIQQFHPRSQIKGSK